MQISPPKIHIQKANFQVVTNSKKTVPSEQPASQPEDERRQHQGTLQASARGKSLLIPFLRIHTNAFASFPGQPQLRRAEGDRQPRRQVPEGAADRAGDHRLRRHRQSASEGSPRAAPNRRGRRRSRKSAIGPRQHAQGRLPQPHRHHRGSSLLHHLHALQ